MDLEKMFRGKLALSSLVAATAVFGSVALAEESTDSEEDWKTYSLDFQSVDEGQVPSDFLILLGSFEVKSEGDQKFMELPGKPLETFGTLFGPEALMLGEVSGRIYGESTGRRFPALGIGYNGVGGFRLQVTPGKRALEIYNYDELKKTESYRWKSGQWLWMKLNVSEKETEDGLVWVAQGKVWKEGEEEPEKWMIEYETDEEPFPGRSSVWGIPYSDKPIRFDDLKVKGK